MLRTIKLLSLSESFFLTNINKFGTVKFNLPDLG